MAAPSASYNFNTMQEIKSHSSILFNERLAILFYLLDMRSMNLMANQDVGSIMLVRATLKQIYKNIRTLIRNNPTMRAWLNLNTKDPGIYVTDYAMATIDQKIKWCRENYWTRNYIDIVIEELNNFETMVKDVLQYYNYFIRPDFKQKPDIELATEMYKEMADENSLEDLRNVVGKSNMIDWEGLGTQRIELNPDKDLEEDYEDE